jgi:Helix-turn-helix domain
VIELAPQPGDHPVNVRLDAHDTDYPWVTFIAVNGIVPGMMEVITTGAAPVDVRARRLAVGLDQRELAERAQCSESMIRILERGYRPRYSDTLSRVIAVIEATEAEAA